MSGRITVPAASVIPQGVGAPPPPGLDPKKGKLMCIKVRMLDDTVGVFHLGHKALGQALFEEVCRHLNLLECDYFGLEFLDSVGNHCWLDKEKPILRQITAARSDARFYFVVKFYPPNPADLEEEYTRYLFALQVKRDLASGQFVVNENTAALMASYIVQSECGDFCNEDYPDHTYLSSVRFIPNQSPDFEKKVMENHKKIIGTNPAESDLALLETARRVEFYGVKFHAAKDIEGTAVNLTVLHLGLKVYHQLSCANTFSWAKIRKLSFKRRKFLIKLHPDSYAYYKDTIEFLFENRNECKMFWKKCIEHHAFFRCCEINRMNKQQSKLFSRGSSFRYSGRTQKQLIDYIREHHRRREPFTRPIHSSFNRRYFNERPLPTPLIPTIHQNGDGPVFITAVGAESDNEILDGVIETGGSLKDLETNNIQYPHRQRDESQERPPTPEAPQLRRKAKGAVITFHFPVTEISPDSPSSERTVSGAQERRVMTHHADVITTSSTVAVTNVSSDVGEWGESSCAYAGTELHPSRDDNFGLLNNSLVVSAFEGANDLDDNVSEDSYHLSDHEEAKETYKQNSTTLPLSSHKPSESAPPPHRPTFSSPTRSDLTPPASAASDYRFSPPPVSTVVKPIEIPSSSSAASVSSVSPPPPPSQNTSSGVSSRGLTGPLPGRVISKTPVITAKQKPIVPPKPKPKIHVQPSEDDATVDQPPVVVLSKSTIVTKEISINSSSQIQPEPPKPLVVVPPVPIVAHVKESAPVPSIEVDSEEFPNIRHKIINGEIPYVLHVRRVTEAASESETTASAQPPMTFSTFRDPSAGGMAISGDSSEYGFLLQNHPSQNNRSRSSNRGTSAAKSRRKSLDLVQRKRLPSPANFSSQDHSVSPDSEHDVVSFVSKWRNSSDSTTRKSSTFDNRRQKRTDPRRMTQPVKLFTPLASSTEVSSFKEKKTVRSQPCLPINDDESGDEFNMDSPSLHDSMEALEKMDAERISNSDLDSPTLEETVTPSKCTVIPYSPRPGSLDPPFIDDDSSRSECKLNNDRSKDFDDCANLLASAAEALRKPPPPIRQYSTDV